MAPIKYGWKDSFNTAFAWLLKVKKVLGRDSHVEISTINFITVFALGNAILYHRLLFSFASKSLDYSSLNGVLTLVTLFVVVVVVSTLFLSIIALISQRLVKPICMLIVFGNAIAIYFEETYRVILDRTMMGNVFNTNFQEAGELFHPKLLIYIFVYAVLPCFFLLKLRIKKDKYPKRFIYLFFVLFFGLGWSFANGRTWLWIDKNASKLGGMVMPWSYISNSIRWYDNNYIRVSRHQTLLPDAHFIETSKEIVILVIGEAARAQDFSLYGYQRLTNPRLAKDGVVALPDATACATYTTAALECMLSHQGSNPSLTTLYEPLPSYLQRNGVDVIWRSNNWGEPVLKIGRYDRGDDIHKSCSKDDRCNYDEVLLYNLEQELQNSKRDKTFVVLHMHGSHGPSYYKNYPEKFTVFKPVCKTVDLQKCTNDELISAYDNTIVYTDYFLDRVINLLKTFQQPTAMMYMSDHGESLGEYGLYLHGTPYSLAPDVQKKVPFIVWMSDEFKKEKGIDNKGIVKNSHYTDDNVFHSVMGAFGMRSDIYKKQFDIFNAE